MRNIIYARTIYADPFGSFFEPWEMSVSLKVLSVGEMADVYLFRERRGAEPNTNIPRFYTFSGSDNWGYFGTGPACLAQNILFHFTSGDEEFVEKNWLDFLKIVAKFPVDKSCKIDKVAILSWIANRTKSPHVIATK